MKSKISFFNTGLVLSNIKRFWWVSVLYFIGLSIFLPLRMIQFSIAYNTNSSALSSISALVSLINMFGIFLWIAPLLIGMLMFHYINKPKSVAMLNPPPYSRTTLIFYQIISGLILIFIPLILNGIILIIRNLTTILNKAYTIPQVLLVIVFIMLFETLIFSSTIFIGMLFYLSKDGKAAKWLAEHK